MDLQLSALQKHPREAVYNVCGNHDRSGLNEPQAWWWRKWVDPTGKNTAHSRVHSERRPYPIEGRWERYSFRVGNILFLMMGDINEPTQTIGRGDLGGNPGAVDIWLGGHTHPDDTYGGKAHVETKWGGPTHFINAASLTRFHGAMSVPKSRLFTFTSGQAEVRVQCYMHTSEFLPQGWYDKAERTLTLSRRFSG